MGLFLLPREDGLESMTTQVRTGWSDSRTLSRKPQGRGPNGEGGVEWTVGASTFGVCHGGKGRN
eukprot:2629758-Amphidinium_carterae.1